MHCIQVERWAELLLSSCLPQHKEKGSGVGTFTAGLLMKHQTKHFLKLLLYATGYMIIALSLFKASLSSFTMIKFSSSPFWHNSYTASYLQPFQHSLGSHLPCVLLSIEGNAHSCRLLTATAGIPHTFVPSEIPLTTLITSHELCPLFKTERRPLALVLEDQRC